ncbi:MAG: penicillin acylase family protein, partial [Candidatus Hodarchaeales archaeon]
MIYRALGVVMRVILKQLSKRKLPQVEGTLELPGLKAPVEVIRDKWGVPHIYAENDHDLFFAQGFVEAQDRFWQLELNRRTATGRLSEIFGEIALDTDRATRTFGFARLGKKDWENADSRFKEIVQAYADGVNAYIQAGKFPVEFSLLRHSPEPWTAEDSMAFSRVMIWQLSHAWYGEIVRSRLIDAVGAEHAAELDIEYPPANPVTLPDGIKINDLAMKDMLDKEKAVGRGKGSNTWTISA